MLLLHQGRVLALHELRALHRTKGLLKLLHEPLGQLIEQGHILAHFPASEVGADGCHTAVDCAAVGTPAHIAMQSGHNAHGVQRQIRIAMLNKIPQGALRTGEAVVTEVGDFFIEYLMHRYFSFFPAGSGPA